MRKFANKASGKSDKHQLHQKKYASSHVIDRLERWYKKMVTPKPEKPKAVFVNNTGRSVEEILNKRQVTPTNAQLRHQKFMKFKRDSHWVARSQLEYDMMHLIVE